jgi:hypothetical protein
MLIMMLEELDEVKKVSGIECSVFKMEKGLEVVLCMLGNELVRTVVHELHKLFALIDNSCSVPPGEGRGKEACYFYVLLFSEEMRYGNGIIFYEGSIIILINFSIKKSLKI